MKTAEEWSKRLPVVNSESWRQHHDNLIDLEQIKQIQLDAYKAGMTEAAEIVRTHVHRKFHPSPLEIRNTFELQILVTRDAKKTI